MSGTVPYSDVSYAVVSLASTSLTWSDQTAPWLLAHTHMYTTDFITMHAATYYFGVLGGRTFE